MRLFKVFLKYTSCTEFHVPEILVGPIATITSDFTERTVWC